MGWQCAEFWQYRAGDERDEEFVSTLVGWEDLEVPPLLMVLLPPVATYREADLARGDDFHWCVFYSEWTVLVFARWCQELHVRNLMWRLPPKVVHWIHVLGVDWLVEGSDLPAFKLRRWLADMTNLDWDSTVHTHYL